MFNDPVSFNGGTRYEVITVLANCGRDTDRARRALVTWIRHKQDKGRNTEHILAKLRDIESKFINDTSLHSAFLDARAETCLPRALHLPLPSSPRRRSTGQTPEPQPSVTTASSTGRVSIASPIMELPANTTQQIKSPSSPWRFLWASSQISETLPGRSNASQRLSPPQNVSDVAQSRLPRIRIPGRSIQPGPSSPITSSPEESEPYLRYRYMSQSVGPSSQFNGPITPVSATPPEFSPYSRDQSFDARRRLSYGLASPPPSARIRISRHQSQRSFPNSTPTSSSDESDFYPRRYRPMSQPIVSMSPGRRLLTPPRSSPPDVPLPPIPSDDQGVDSDSGESKKSLLIELPPSPLRSPMLHSPTAVRPLPIQPIPSPVEGSDEDESSADSLRPNWREPCADLPADVVVRQDSPVYVFHDDHVSPTGVGPPPPYADQHVIYSSTDMTISDSLDKVVNEYGGSLEVRLVVSKCIEFQPGYEPPYWQTCLQACGLGAEAARHLVDEMCKQVDWGALFRRST